MDNREDTDLYAFMILIATVTRDYFNRVDPEENSISLMLDISQQFLEKFKEKEQGNGRRND